MPNRFPTEAANAPVLGEDPDDPQAARDGADRAPPTQRDGTPAPRGERRFDRGEAKPGKDINQAGFLKDTDPKQP